MLRDFIDVEAGIHLQAGMVLDVLDVDETSHDQLLPHTLARIAVLYNGTRHVLDLPEECGNITAYEQHQKSRQIETLDNQNGSSLQYEQRKVKEIDGQCVSCVVFAIIVMIALLATSSISL